MLSWACTIWPLLLGGLLGWLACGWLARGLRGHDQGAVVAAKDAELSRISAELADWRKRPPVEVQKIVDRVVEKPVDRVVEKIVEKPVDRVVEKIVEKVVEKPVDRIVEKRVDNPEHLANIARLTAEVAVVAGLRSRITQLESAPPKVVEKVVDRVVDRVVEKLVPDTAGLAARDAEIKRLKQAPAIDVAAAKRAGFDVKTADDIVIIEGIGPRIAELFHKRGVRTFAQIAEMTPAQIQPILDEGGPNFRIANPETWPEQAALAMHNRWAALRSLQDVLVAGVRVDANAQKQAQEQATRALTDRIQALERQLAESGKEMRALRRAPPIDVAAARAAGFTGVKGEDDLEVVEGIGPKIADLCKVNGIRTFAELANTDPARLQEILDAAGPNYKMADPETWPDQAELASRNRWRALKSLQDSLVGGKRRS